MPKRLEAKRKFCVGRRQVQEEFQEEMGYKFVWDGNKMSGLTARTMWKIILFNAPFQEAIAGANVELNWLLKVRSHLDKIEKEQRRISVKSCLVFPEIQALRNWSLSDSMSTSFINSNHIFLYCNSQCPDFENLYTLLTIGKTYKLQERVNAISQTYRHGTNLEKKLTREKKNNDLVDDAGNLSESGKQLDKG